jgi:FtsZ-binding cell division protein ZapB
MDNNAWTVSTVEEADTMDEDVEANAEIVEDAEEADTVDEDVVSMDITEGVERLVEAINSAVATIEDLRRENAELKQQSQALQSDISRLEEEQVGLRSERDRLQDIYNDNMLLIDNKAEILNKVEAMLQRLNSLNPEKNE